MSREICRNLHCKCQSSAVVFTDCDFMFGDCDNLSISTQSCQLIFDPTNSVSCNIVFH